ncbi:MAG: hypothetical protein JW874_12705 [Spirochaetales bacterium]|nr:hypothetical protein [Spirochaetales bacterium]
MKKMVLLILAFAVLFPAALSAQADSGFKDVFIEAGVTAGLWLGFPAQVWFDGEWHTKQPSVLAKGNVVVYFVDYFYLGTALNLAPYYSYDRYSGNSAGFAEIAALFGIRFFLGEKMAIKTGVEVGYRLTWGNNTESQIDGVGINLNAEFQYKLKGWTLVVNPGFLSQVAGSEEHGGSYYFQSWAPMLYLNVGIAFTLSERKS